jgi:2,3-bisphosphoglycerate-dependent phosphoglycerate mutase
MRTVWLIRHAQSESNASLPTFHPAAPTLTPRGIDEARHVAQAFSERPDLIITSPYIRTQQTAQPTCDRFPDVPQEEWPVQEFTYLALHTHAPMTRQERRPYVDAFWERCDPWYHDGDGTESFAEFIGRAEAMLASISQREEGFIAIFTHGYFMRALLWLLLMPPQPLSAKRMARFQSFAVGVKIPNASIVRLYLADTILLSQISTDHLPANLA